MRRKIISRRKFLSTTAAACVLTAFRGYTGKDSRRSKMILSFYLDDTNPEIVKAKAFSDFVDFCHKNGVKGEASFIPGYNGRSIVSDHDKNQLDYIENVKQAWSKGIDSHMEIMTHSTLFDFKTGRKKEDGIHEGLWLHEPAVSVSEYKDYFTCILDEAEKAGIRFTGLTWPGCGCEVCTKRYAELKKQGPLHITNNAFESLLSLAKSGRFRNRVIPIFYEASETDFGIFKRASEGKYGVYDLMPNAMDHFGIWENATSHVDPDYYITENGKSGILIRHLDNNSPYCMWYMHWQGVNPEKGVGWEAFKTVISRIREHLGDQVVWMRPGDIVTAFHDTGSWDFIKNI